MNEPWFYVVWAIGAYLVGSISVGDVVSRLSGVDIRSAGSGNPGTANVYRQVGKKSAAAVFVIDLAKGAAATVPFYFLDLPVWAPLIGAWAVLAGHFFPLFWGFKGGTGMMVGVGAAIGFLWLGAVIAVPFGAAYAMHTKDMARAGVTFLLVTVIAGGISGVLMDQSIFGAVAVVLITLTVGVKSYLQYDHWRQPT
jgi:glycerol-3-phosphate acyltransferase PlsY